MDRKEAAEWAVMILIIIAWWPILFGGWGPPAYRYGLEVASALSLGIIFWRRLKRVNAGLAESERMFRDRIEAEKAARGGDPSLSDPVPPKRRR
jgi:hypothetical protein